MDMELGSLFGLLEAGGTVMWIIASLSVVALAIVLAKLWEFARVGVWRRAAAGAAVADWEAGRPEAARNRLENAAGPVADVLGIAVEGHRRGIDQAAVREEVARRGAAWLEALRTGLRPLELIGTLAPLLGLLGTVIGMIDAFRELEAAGGRVDPSVLSGGIWVALLTTAAGLSVAIPAVAAHTLLERLLERLHHRMQDGATRILNDGFAGQRDRAPATEGGQQSFTRLAEAVGAD
jgi:biopolymer transport protein ExbB